jgi:type II secretion system protein D
MAPFHRRLVVLAAVAALSASGWLTVATAQDGEAAAVQSFRPRHVSADVAASRLNQRLKAEKIEAEVLVDARANSVLLRGSPEAQRQATRAWLSIDQPAKAEARVVLQGGVSGERRETLPLEKADPAQVKEIIRLLNALPVTAKGKRFEFIAQPQPAEGAQPPPGDEPPAEEMPAEEEPRLPRGQLRIDIDEPTGRITIIGPREEVDRAIKLIRDLTEQARLGKPEIEILRLRHISDRAVGDLLTQIYDQVFGSRTARVTFTPLVRPNALLLIGPRESVDAVRELVEKLDQPVAPASQLRVFSLRHISATDAEATVRAFFVDQAAGGTAAPAPAGTQTSGLGTRVSVVAEVRSNALIVQGSPRDLAEVGELLRRIDVIDTPATSEVRVFRLRNALAEELAPVLQQAVTGQGGTTGGGGQGQPATQGAGTSGTQTTPRSTSLRLLQIDGQTRRIVESGILSDVRISADTRGNAIVVRGPSTSMDLIGALIDQLDQLPGAAASIKVFTLENGDAQTLINSLQQLFGQPTTGQGGGGGGAAAFNLPIISGGGENSLVPLRFALDQRTNSIIASGALGDLEVVERILLRLDESDVRRRKTTVYRLRNAPAADVSNAINQFLQNQRLLQQQIGQGLTSQVEQIEREVVVVPELVSNSLLVSATPRYYEEIKRIVEDLDRRPPMVVIQCLIAEVTLNNTDEFGVELGLQDSTLFHRGIPGTGFNFNTTNPLPNQSTFGENVLAPQGLTNFGVGRGNSTLGYGGLVLSASSDTVSLLIRALQQANRIQVLSRPQVQTLDNQAGFVQVGARVPYVTSSNQTQFGIQNAITFQNVGILLQVVPRTSPDGLIVMQISAEKSQLSSDAEGVPTFISSSGQVIKSPQIFINTAQTVVSAQSGQTVMLGGLITNSREQETRRTPYISDIPVLGRLFRYDREVNKKTELLLIMTPYIVRSEEDIERINVRESERMNWCLADVAAVHGEMPWAKGTGPWNKNKTPVIFPDADPTARTAPTEEVPPPAGARENRFEPVERDPTPDGVFEQQPR